MIEEIIKLRGDGLSFRRIASELNTTVGRVQYRWNKWVNKIQPNKNATPSKESESLECNTTNNFVPLKGELQCKLVSPRKMIIFWEASDIPRKVIQLFFNRSFEDLIQVVRIYDVTDLIFNGSNAHYYHEIPIPYNNGHWFIKGLVANRSYIAELGVYFSEKNFFPVLRSKTIQTPMAELTNGQEFYHDLLQYQQYEDQPPKWIDHVSTYSYYGKTKIMEENNG